MDEKRCALAYFAQEKSQEDQVRLKLRHVWTSRFLMELAEEVLDVLQQEVGRGTSRVYLAVIHQESLFAGLHDDSKEGRIYINPYTTVHPLDMVGTIIHEIAHRLVADAYNIHDGECVDGHCGAWVVVSKMLTAIFKNATIPEKHPQLRKMAEQFGSQWRDDLYMSKCSCGDCEEVKKDVEKGKIGWWKQVHDALMPIEIDYITTQDDWYFARDMPECRNYFIGTGRVTTNPKSPAKLSTIRAKRRRVETPSSPTGKRLRTE